jgi:uncharacterized protein
MKILLDRGWLAVFTDNDSGLKPFPCAFEEDAMSNHTEEPSQEQLSRRKFLMASGALVTGGALTLGGVACAQNDESATGDQQTAEAQGEAGGEAHVTRFRRMGRTDFQVSDVSMGCGSIQEANVVRYAYDHGINYFDVAESYGNGESEKRIGEAMEFMDRKKIFITTKLAIEPDETEESITTRFTASLERLQTNYADALYMHSITDAEMINHPAFHAACDKFKADGKLKYVGISSHGPRGDEGDAMDTVLCAAADDGRYDLMLLSYNFLNEDEALRVLASCKAKDVGTTAMKIMPGMIDVPAWDEENPDEMYTDYIERVTAEGEVTREEAIERIGNWITRQQDAIAEAKPFADKYGAKTNDEFQAVCLKWVFSNPDMHTVCASMPNFEELEKILPFSGQSLSKADLLDLEQMERALGKRYCRHGCTACVTSCPQRMPVSTIMRYSHYFARQKREKHAMVKYAALKDRNAAACGGCSAPCDGACPHGVQIQANMLAAHRLLSLT